MKDKIIYLIQFFIILTFIFSAVGYTYYEALNKILQYFVLLITFVYIIIELRFGKYKKGIISILLFSFLLLLLLPYFSKAPFVEISSGYIIPIFLGYMLSIGRSCVVNKCLFIFFLLNAMAVVYELFTKNKVVLMADGYEYTSDLIYKVGLFSNPKEGGTFIALVGLIALKEKRFWLVIIGFFLSILTGVRTATFVLLIPFVWAIFYYLRFFFHKQLKTSLIIFCIIIFFFQVLCQFITDNNILFDRLFGMFSTNDQGNDQRLYFILRHLEIFNSHFNIFEMIFGRYGYSLVIVGNGGESALVKLVLNTGICTFLLYMVPIFNRLLFCYKYRTNLIYGILIIAMCISSIGLGFTGGSLLWLIIFRDLKTQKGSLLINKKF